ncbi:3-oxoacyl-[acyl-carrier-protein] reductase [Opitutales bacterium ASA1]|uniref:3-oxoacyl-[acyl-carrier-protein] reductase n=1 Tax=Congregicoccus parvus TaxID=3081749 RepID=UPI002B3207CE|nr:3-oxoacyl-[acyl-carrier-protein] reductase [Opitutales bacterium ASA1]
MTSETRTAVVTGAGRGIGRAIAEGLAARGITVVCVSKNPESCSAAADAIKASGGNARALAVDVSSGAEVAKACTGLIEEFRTIDILVNNAGITRDGLLLRMSEDDWNSVIQTNLSSCFFWMKGLIQPMVRKRWGRIVNIASVSGITGLPGQINYSAAKAGMIGLTKAAAKEFASRTITVNAVAPGFIKTDMTSSMSEGETAKEIISRIPLKRFGEAGDVASLVTYLCSDEAAYITGQVFTVDGGMVM